MTTKLSEKIDTLDLKLRQYLQYTELVKQENEDLQQQVLKLKTNLATVNDKMTQLQRQLEHSKLELEQEGQEKEKQSKQLKKQLGQYIQYVDECMEWLQNG